MIQNHLQYLLYLFAHLQDPLWYYYRDPPDDAYHPVDPMPKKRAADQPEKHLCQSTYILCRKQHGRHRHTLHQIVIIPGDNRDLRCDNVRVFFQKTYSESANGFHTLKNHELHDGPHQQFSGLKHYK